MDFQSLIIGGVGGIIGGAFTTYFTFLRSKNERLLNEKYEALKNIIINIDLFKAYLGIDGCQITRRLSKTEQAQQDRLLKEIPNILHELSKNMAMLRLLFIDKDIETLKKLYDELTSAFFTLSIAVQKVQK